MTLQERDGRMPACPVCGGPDRASWAPSEEGGRGALEQGVLGTGPSSAPGLGRGLELLRESVSYCNKKKLDHLTASYSALGSAEKVLFAWGLGLEKTFTALPALPPYPVIGHSSPSASISSTVKRCQASPWGGCQVFSRTAHATSCKQCSVHKGFSVNGNSYCELSKARPPISFFTR